MTAIDVELGKVYWVRIVRRPGEQVEGLRIAMATGKASGGDVIMRLKMGQWGWAKPRRVSATAIAREATAREQIVGMPVMPVPLPG